MIEFLREAGFGVLFVLLFGTWATVESVRFLRRGEPRALVLVGTLLLATVAAGLLATLTGMQVSARHAMAHADPLTLMTAGFCESLNGMLLALGITLFDAILVGLGLARRGDAGRAPVNAPA